MIDRMFDEVALTCDTCPASTDFVPKTRFDDLVNNAKDQGWKITPVSDGWRHLCSDCGNENALERARRKFGVK